MPSDSGGGVPFARESSQPLSRFFSDLHSVNEIGGATMFSQRFFECVKCGSIWDVHYGERRPDCCPECGCTDIKRSLRGILFDQTVMANHVID